MCLAGFMGTGKTTVAGTLGKMTGFPVIELDEEIVKAEGKPIPQIFEEVGEEGFREIETRELKKALGVKDAAFPEKAGVILSLGGGAVLREENRRVIRENGFAVLLTAKPETVLARVYGDGNRPNLKGRMTREGVASLMKEREAAYEAAAEYTISTDGKGVREIAGEILKEWGAWQLSGKTAAGPEKEGQY